MVSESDIGTYKDDDGLTYDQWSERKTAEAAAHQRERGLEARLAALESRVEQRFAALERRMKARYSELIEAVGLAFGDMRGEIDDRLAKDAEVRERTFAVDERAELVRLARQVKACSREIEELRQEIAELKSRGKKTGKIAN
ncbi:MAG: hypothetical protein KK482_20170 [Sinorhizobium meliloti]|nr:hypothetical protein [Sinorhizobium meliloti]